MKIVCSLAFESICSEPYTWNSKRTWVWAKQTNDNSRCAPTSCPQAVRRIAGGADETAAALAAVAARLRELVSALRGAKARAAVPPAPPAPAS